MYYGADYYPEHWAEDRWELDAKLMKEANLNVVRLGEFSWAKLEPQEGEYDFTWLDRAIDTLWKQEISVVLGTPTAAPPKWLMDKYPSIYQVTNEGNIRGFGSRRHYCFNNEIYIKYTKLIVKAMAQHYKDNPALVAWQIDNEFGCHDNYCFCNCCHKSFIKWLQEKYQCIDELNKEWGTVFWSQTYRNFDEVILPSLTECDSTSASSMTNAYTHNPGLLLDFYRFSSDSVVKYQKLQIDEIRKWSKKPVTHNYMGHFSDIDYFNLGKDLNFVSWDNYIVTPWGKNDKNNIAMAHDLMRGIKRKNYWVMEQQSGPCGWNTIASTPEIGQIRLWAHQSVAHGAEGLLYFRWRACTFGTEQYWYGILDHDGIKRRRYEEVKRTGEELKKLSNYIVDSEIISEIAIIKSYDNVWSHRIQPHNIGFDYNKILMDYYNAISASHVNIDVVSIEDNLNKYKVVVLPAFNLMRDDIKERLEKYAEEGGIVVVTYRSGTKDWNNKMTTTTLPGYFKKLTGLEVEEFDSLCYGKCVDVEGSFGSATASVWCDILKLNSAKGIAYYKSSFYKEKPAIAVNNYGKGKVYYVGCDLDNDALKNFMSQILKENNIKKIVEYDCEQFEVVRKQKGNEEYLIILNHGDTNISLPIDKTYKDMITGVNYEKIIEIEGYGVRYII